MIDNRDHYRQLTNEDSSIPIFAKSWWLDAVAGEHWNVSLAVHGDTIQAALPYTTRRRAGRLILGQPQLTQFLGPWFKPAPGKAAARLARQKDLMFELVDGLPTFAQYAQNWNPDITNWLPFHWKGFDQTTRYTYALTDLKDADKLWSGLQANARTDIRKASQRFSVRLREEPVLDDFIRLHEQTFARQNKSSPYSQALIHKLDAACAEHDCRKIFIAEDEEGRAHAAAYVVWDGQTAYYLMGGGDPDLRNSGATSYCLWEAIQFASTIVDRFDFEGSMIEPIERFFRSFGALQLPYFRVSKTPSRLLKFRAALRTIL
ncbi:MAG TPA: GNAT family N-acetyltransferase [Devosiaceae bacterium]